jgi:hypothetical protein
MISTSNFEPIEVDDPRAERYSSAVRSTHVNGGIVIACFRPNPPVSVSDLLRGMAWLSVPHAFLQNASVRHALADLAIPAQVTLGDVCWQSSYELEGGLVQTLVLGGAYESWEKRENDARTVARDFVDSLSEGRRLGLNAFRIPGAWTSWFFDVAWDSTYLVCHFDSDKWWLICSTDTD